MAPMVTGISQNRSGYGLNPAADKITSLGLELNGPFSAQRLPSPPKGLFPPASSAEDFLPESAVPSADPLSTAPEIPARSESQTSEAAPPSSRKTLEDMGRMTSAMPDRISDYFTGASRRFGSFVEGPQTDGTAPLQSTPGTNFFGGLTPTTPRPGVAPKKAIDLSPVTPDFISRLNIPTLDARVLQAAEALLKRLKLYKWDMRLFISALAALPRPLLRAGFIPAT
jgi:hypothetical protein